MKKNNTFTKGVPAPEQLAKWSRVKLVDEYCYAFNHGQGMHREALFEIKRGTPEKAIPFLNTLQAEFERASNVASELNRRLPRIGAGPIGGKLIVGDKRGRAHEAKKDPLIGKFLHTFTGADRKTLLYQGEIIGIDEGGVVLVQLFEWFAGTPTKIVPMMRSFVTRSCALYADREAWLFANEEYNRQRHHEEKIEARAKADS